MNEHLPVEREVRFPVYRKFTYRIDEEMFPRTYEPGRVILNSHWVDWADINEGQGGFLNPALPELVGPNDVVYAPLYDGTCERASEGTSEPGPFYDHNIEMMRRIAPAVKAILIGNAGTELTFKHCWWRDRSRGPQYASYRAAIFVRQVGTLVRECGGRPAFGTMDWDLGIDCYLAHGILRQAIIEMDALQICFCGWKLLTAEMCPQYYREVGPPESGGRNDRGDWKDTPVLRQYLRGTETIGGVGHPEGLQAGNDLLLEKAGFAAGNLGVR